MGGSVSLLQEFHQGGQREAFYKDRAKPKSAYACHLSAFALEKAKCARRVRWRCPDR